MAGATFQQAVTLGGEISAAPHNDAWDNLEDYINDRLADGTSGQLIVCDSSGNPRPATISGDITVDSNGVATLAAGSVDPLMLNAEIGNDHELIFQDGGKFVDQHLSSASAGPYALKWPMESGISDQGYARLFAYDNDWHDLTGKFTDLVIRVAVKCYAQMGVTATLGLYRMATAIDHPLQANLVADSGLAISNVAAGSCASIAGVQFDEPTDGCYCLGMYFNGTTSSSMDIEVHASIYKRRSNS
jgi:hypothetical protein